MTDSAEIVEGLPTARSCPFSPPDALGELREERPITRMSYADGTLGWLITDHALARELLTHPDFSSRHELRSSPVPMAIKPMPAPPGMFIGMDPPQHTRYRKPLNRHFTVRRVRQLEPAIERIVTQHIDAMERHGPPADLVSAFALPIPVQVISELLGADPGISEEISRLRAVTLDPATPPEEAGAAVRATNEVMADLVRGKRRSPSGDLLSVLIADGDMTDQELTGLAFLMFIAGHETTANMFSLGTYLALRDERARASLTGGGVLTDEAVNEFLRYLSIVQFTSRAALADVEFGGVLVRKGETVTLSISAANRDGRRFPQPDTFDVDGGENGHLAFGHGIHQCIGHNLARAELRIGLPELFRRLPGLRLADESRDVATRVGHNTYGVLELPVAW
ncbi:cytochrome P450 [Streptomyces lucensis JCM 4490]|uniref:Cytochrome P450 n=1 Tax=Streptomyces lucensis JCM 4490 TaxID=1306176 RepID=A0A918MWX3_9ACTN|nr:cytochrome P450 [Streptomyces lucensis]GGW82240.1 cytochrome P450 [Streptomyces lucensis JCM 4490]